VAEYSPVSLCFPVVAGELITLLVLERKTRAAQTRHLRFWYKRASTSSVLCIVRVYIVAR
jgi:hypothetical protein